MQIFDNLAGPKVIFWSTQITAGSISVISTTEVPRPTSMTMNQSDSKFLTAALHGSLRDVEKLLNDGADLKVTGSDGSTPLHCAAMRGHLSVVKKLLEFGADATITNKSGSTPRELAKKNMYTDVAGVERYKEVIKLFDNPPVFVKEAKPKVNINPQAAPTENDNGRREICEYFKGHILHWFGNLSKEADYSVYNIIYGDGLAESVGKLEEKHEELRKDRVKNEEAAKRKEALMKRQETKDEEKSREKDELKQKRKPKNRKSDEQAEQAEQLTTQSSEESQEADIEKEAKRWIHLPANNVCSKTPCNKNYLEREGS